MKNTFKLGLCTAAAIALATSVHATPSPTAPVLFLWDSTGATLSVVDNDGTDMNSGLGSVSWNSGSGNFGNWSVSVSAGLSKPAQGDAVTPNMDLQFGAKAVAGGTIHIAFFDNSFGPSGLAGALATIGGTFGSGTGQTLNYSTYTEANNNIPTFLGGALNMAGFNLLTSQNFNSGAAVTPFGGNATGPLISGGANPYSLLQVITITTSSAMRGAVTGDSSLTVPDGGMTLMLLGSGLTGLALLRRSSKAKA
jgi:hypothetical protein